MPRLVGPDYSRRFVVTRFIGSRLPKSHECGHYKRSMNSPGCLLASLDSRDPFPPVFKKPGGVVGGFLKENDSRELLGWESAGRLPQPLARRPDVTRAGRGWPDQPCLLTRPAVVRDTDDCGRNGPATPLIFDRYAAHIGVITCAKNKQRHRTIGQRPLRKDADFSSRSSNCSSRPLSLLPCSASGSVGFARS